MKLLLLPSDLGGGFGHVSRCLALADEAGRRGHRCVFVLNNPKYFNTVRRRFPAHLCPKKVTWAERIGELVPRRARPGPPLFSEFSGLDYQVPRDGLLNRKVVEQRLEHYFQVVQEEKPDILVGDTNLLVRLLAARTGLPSVQLVRFASHPDTARLIWWKDVPEELIPPCSADLFNPLLEHLKLPPIHRAEDLLRGDLHLVPSLPEIEPIPPDDHTVHLGALVDTGREEQAPARLDQLPTGQPLVYATLGGGSEMAGNRELAGRLVSACGGRPIQVVLATGGRIRKRDLPPLPGNIHLLSWAPGQLLIRGADLVIFHGGYGTMMETLAAGTPSLVIPFQSEQEGNGRRLEQLGCGLVMKPSRSEPVTMANGWDFGRYTFRAQTDCDLTPEELVDAMDRLMGEERFTEQAEAIRKKLLQRPGAEKALDHLEPLLA